MTSSIKDIEKTIRALKSRRFNARFASNKDKARDIILELVPSGASVGIGDSTTLFQIGVIPELEVRGCRVFNPFRTGEYPERGNPNSMYRTVKETLGNEVYITGANSVTKDGRLVSVDGAGNRVVGMIFGAPKVLLVLGQNKIVEDLEAAWQRLRKVICPAHAKHRGWHTPCVRTGECVDCSGKNRICNVIGILEGKPMMTDVSVIIVAEDLGLGWDPDWPTERIDKIWRAYTEKCWRPAIDFEKV